MNKKKMISSLVGTIFSVSLLLFTGTALWGFDADEIETELLKRFRLKPGLPLL